MRALRWLPALLAVLALLAAGVAAWRQDWTYDERIHLAWSERLLKTGETERTSVHRYNSKTPLQVPNVLCQRAAQAMGVSDPRALRFAARVPGLLWLAALLAAVFLTARHFFGDTAARLATAGAAVEPNLIAHGSLATSDVPFTLAVLLALASAAHFAAAPSVRRAAVMGLALGLAFVAKFNAVLLLPLLALAPLAAPRRPDRRGLLRFAGGLALAAAVAAVVLCGAYLARELGQPLGAREWRWPGLQRAARAAPWLPLPVPAAFLTGLDLILALERPPSGQPLPAWNTVVLGRLYPHGVWFYFLLLWVLKTPLLLLAAEVVGLVKAARARVLVQPAARYFAACLVLLLAYLSFLFHAHIGYRFALPCVPLALMLAGAGLAARPPRWGLQAGLAVAVVAVAENAMYAGNPISFTNAAVWPKRQVFRLISDSNVDWGQNRDKIEGWMKAAGAAGTALDPPHVLQGRNTFGLNGLAGVSDFERYRWLRENAQPRGHHGHTYVWFDVDGDLFGRFLHEKRRLAPQPQFETLCGDLELTLRRANEHHPIYLSGPPPPGEVWILCATTRRGGRLGLRTLHGHARFAPLTAQGLAGWETLELRQEAWYQLEPGGHVLAVAQIPNRRAWLPNVFQGEFEVRERSVALALRRGQADASGRLTAVRAAAAP